MGKILIVDCSEESRRMLSGALEQEYEVVCCGEGERALELLERLRPDLMILDPILAGMDGMEVLRLAAQREQCPVTIITGRFFSDHFLNRLAQYPVQYVLRKPFALSALVNRVQELLGTEEPEQLREQDPYALITTMLHELSVPTNFAGFHQCRIGIARLAQKPGMAVTKELYPAIAQESGRGNAQTVERNIRSAIARAYANRDDRVWRRYFRPAPNGQIPRPSNTEFLTRLAEEITWGQVRKAK